MTHSMFQERAQRWLACGGLVLLLGACSGERAAPKTASNAEDRTTLTVTPPAVSEARVESTEGNDDATDVNVSEELRSQCQVPEAPADAPKFNFDEAALTPRGRDTLQHVARCLSEGPMQGRAVTIIGRADPRGTEQYNQELAMDRARSARDYLVAYGVSEGQIQLVSHGEGGAEGTNEATWALDRRVDIEVARPEPVSARTEGDRGSESDRDGAKNPFVEARRIQASDPHREPESPESSKARVYADQPEGGEVIATQP
jgi:outer membrane protein OmpA-like peptidoglycan-associated protein